MAKKTRIRIDDLAESAEFTEETLKQVRGGYSVSGFSTQGVVVDNGSGMLVTGHKISGASNYDFFEAWPCK